MLARDLLTLGDNQLNNYIDALSLQELYRGAKSGQIDFENMDRGKYDELMNENKAAIIARNSRYAFKETFDVDSRSTPLDCLDRHLDR